MLDRLSQMLDRLSSDCLSRQIVCHVGLFVTCRSSHEMSDCLSLCIVSYVGLFVT